MFTIRNYTDTKCELEMAKTRLNLLMDKKERLYCKYFPLTPQLKEDVVDGGEKNKDKMADYLHELHEVDYGTGKSLATEITEQQNTVDKLQGYLNLMSDILSKFTGIEYQLFYEIAYKGTNITKAVENISNKYDIDTRSVWRNHYKKIKKYVKKLNSPVICQ